MKYPKMLSLIFLVGLVSSCATEGSLTAADRSADGSVAIQVENGATGETFAVPGVLSTNADKSEIDAKASQIARELGWILELGAATRARPTIIDNPEAPGTCPPDRPCGPYTDGGCRGSSASCYCITVCG